MVIPPVKRLTSKEAVRVIEALIYRKPIINRPDVLSKRVKEA